VSNINDHINKMKQRKPAVSARIQKLASTILLTGSLLTGSAQASVSGSVTQRAVAVRETLGRKLSEAQTAADRQALKEKLPHAPVELAQWMNWGNWGNWSNWNNWNNWRDWTKWSNWGDFSNS
jgi:hypothetical protein